MTLFSFPDDPEARRHAVRRGPPAAVDGSPQPVRALGDGCFVTEIDGRPVQVLAVAHGDTVHLQLGGRGCVVERVDPARGGGAGAGAGGDAAAPMPGVVVDWVARPGDTVKAGDALLVIESMKLQLTVEAPRDGVLDSLPFAPGQSFDRGAILAHLRAGDAAE